MSADLTIVVLLIMGLALMGLEAFVPSFGILGLGGAASFIAALVMAYDARSIYGMEVDIPTLVALGLIGLVVLKISLYFTWKSLRVRLFAGSETLPGMSARVISWEDGRGRVHVEGEEWAAASADALASGDAVRILSRDHLVLIVEKEAGTKS
ncbi:MAG: hypothetical protein KDJ49_06830 [Alphaproteobacteria bacterium]|nr:hypothetical protein [Alphaproteobacteria bacterium]USO07448.1 MAG: hypothetical protein H6866_08550 [Rhodospirillales bacterium]